MPRCKDVAELVATDAWRGPPHGRRLRVLFHLAMCRYCRAYVRQLRRLAETARWLLDGTTVDPATAARITGAVRQAAEQAPPPAPSDPL